LRGQAAVIDIDPVGDGRIGRADNIDALGRIESAAGKRYASCVVLIDGRVVGGKRGVLFACGGDVIHLVVTKGTSLGLLLFRGRIRFALAKRLSRDD
jgi:hypothetical protein